MLNIFPLLYPLIFNNKYSIKINPITQLPAFNKKRYFILSKSISVFLKHNPIRPVASILDGIKTATTNTIISAIEREFSFTFLKKCLIFFQYPFPIHTAYLSNFLFISIIFPNTNLLNSNNNMILISIFHFFSDFFPIVRIYK